MSWEPQNYVAAGAALVAAGTALVTYRQGKHQIAAAKEVAQRQIESAQAVAKQQIESAQSVARTQLIMPMREAWIGALREKVAFFMATCMATFSGEKVTDTAERFRLLTTRYEILLMLNVLDEMHRLLDRALNDLLRDALAKPKEKEKFENSARTARSAAFIVLRSEWEKASGEEQSESSIEPAV